VRTTFIVTLGLAALLLGLDKVKNEHRMTEMYLRQAVALERIADAARLRVAFGGTEGVSFALHEVPFVEVKKPAAKKFNQSTCGPVGADCTADCPGWGKVRFKEGLHFDDRFLKQQGVISARLPEVCR
jgi:hypothetical protein